MTLALKQYEIADNSWDVVDHATPRDRQCVFEVLEVRPEYDVTPAPWLRGAESVDSVIRDLLGEEFANRVQSMWPGREVRFLETDPDVERLTDALRRTPDVSRAIEPVLDELFEDVTPGELFGHTPVVIAMLYALKQAGSEAFKDIADVFAGTTAVEVGPLRRFAVSLLNR